MDCNKRIFFVCLVMQERPLIRTHRNSFVGDPTDAYRPVDAYLKSLPHIAKHNLMLYQQ